MTAVVTEDESACHQGRQDHVRGCPADVRGTGGVLPSPKSGLVLKWDTLATQGTRMLEGMLEASYKHTFNIHWQVHTDACTQGRLWWCLWWSAQNLFGKLKALEIVDCPADVV